MMKMVKMMLPHYGGDGEDGGDDGVGDDVATLWCNVLMVMVCFYTMVKMMLPHCGGDGEDDVATLW